METLYITASVEEPPVQNQEASPAAEEPISQTSSHSDEVPMDQDLEEPPSTPSEDMSQDTPMKELKSGPSRMRRNKPKVNLIQRNKPNLPAPRKSKPIQSKNSTTQIIEEPPPSPQQPLKKAVTPTTTATPTLPAESSDNQPSFFEFIENEEISPHRKKKVDTIDLTEAEDDLPLVRKPKLKESKTPKGKKQKPTQSNLITKYLSPPENKTVRSKNYDSEEELPGFEYDNQQQQSTSAYNFVIIENPTLDKTNDFSHNSEDEIPETFDLTSPIPNLRRTEPTPPPLGNIRSKQSCGRSNYKKKKAAQEPVPSNVTATAGTMKNLNATPGKYNKLSRTIHPYLLLIRNRKDLAAQPEVFESVEVIECKPGTVQCGFCGNIVVSVDWVEHLGTHYGVGWKVGEPDEVSLLLYFLSIS